MRGQHFLIDNRIAERQVGYASLSNKDTILEIGPGYGVLTKRIARNAGKVIAIEIDARLASSLRGIPNAEVICGDALNIDFDSLEFNKVVSNLPYQISSPITFKLLKKDFELGILMYQKEFADRLVAKPGSEDYSRLSVMASYAADWEMLEVVPPSAFRPEPKVYSCIVKVIPRKPKFVVKNEEIFYDLTRVLFSHRRKKIKNALLVEKLVNLDEIDDIPYKDSRVEEISPAEIGKISDVIADMKGEND
ncbi:MAG: 16S rRNA (adenine(1518)-N(6)/adenine(1519)-N(6))-dimethyltransferase RsmA [Candidatus Thermoplasmatota archaeon]|nr:16S rRNA (adenine(1518)-N(6)/adenine(1519)-N(6))-dimethyltransferase RsmA [Candidatus Thermoplasmatota archaeon]